MNEYYYGNTGNADNPSAQQAMHALFNENLYQDNILKR
jgi:hypothetical protein